MLFVVSLEGRKAWVLKSFPSVLPQNDVLLLAPWRWPYLLLHVDESSFESTYWNVVGSPILKWVRALEIQYAPRGHHLPLLECWVSTLGSWKVLGRGSGHLDSSLDLATFLFWSSGSSWPKIGRLN